MSEGDKEYKRTLEDENEGYEMAKRGLSIGKRSVITMVKGYTEEDVQALDVQTGDFQSMLSRIRRKYDEVNDSIDAVLEDVESGV